MLYAPGATPLAALRHGHARRFAYYAMPRCRLPYAPLQPLPDQSHISLAFDTIVRFFAIRRYAAMPPPCHTLRLCYAMIITTP